MASKLSRRDSRIPRHRSAMAVAYRLEPAGGNEGRDKNRKGEQESGDATRFRRLSVSFSCNHCPGNPTGCEDSVQHLPNSSVVYQGLPPAARGPPCSLTNCIGSLEQRAKDGDGPDWDVVGTWLGRGWDAVGTRFGPGKYRFSEGQIPSNHQYASYLRTERPAPNYFLRPGARTSPSVRCSRISHPPYPHP